MTGSSYEERHEALHRGSRLEWITVAWNLGEFAFTVAVGLAAGSLALVAYGLDSLIEVAASLVVIRYIATHEAGGRAARAMRRVGWAYAGLALFLVVTSVRALLVHEVAEAAPLGMAYLVIAASGMFVLSWRKGRLAEISGSLPLAAEARLTLLDGFLATSILVALLLSWAAGLWWLDPAAALLVGGLAAMEARGSFHEAAGLDGDHGHHDELGHHDHDA